MQKYDPKTPCLGEPERYFDDDQNEEFYDAKGDLNIVDLHVTKRDLAGTSRSGSWAGETTIFNKLGKIDKMEDEKIIESKDMSINYGSVLQDKHQTNAGKQ